MKLKPVPDPAKGDKPMEPMVIAFDPRMSEAWEILGMKEHYNTQLQKEMMRRAAVANVLDDENIQLKSVLANMEQELANTRTEKAGMEQRMAQLELELRIARGKAGGRKKPGG